MPWPGPFKYEPGEERGSTAPPEPINLGHLRFVRSHPVGARVHRVKEGPEQRGVCRQHVESMEKELPAGSLQVAINQSGKLAPTKGKEEPSQQLWNSTPEGAEPEAGYK